MPAMRNQSLIGICVLVFGLLLAWEVGGRLADGDMKSIIFIALGFIGCADSCYDIAKLAHRILFISCLDDV